MLPLKPQKEGTYLMSLKSKIGMSLIATLMGLAATTTVVKYNEGYSPPAYKDSAGVWTQCYGETKGVVPGSVKTGAECAKQLQTSLTTHGTGLAGLRDDTPLVAALGALDLTYNVGVYGFNNSKVKRLMKAGDYTGAGQAVLDWKYIHKVSKTRPGKDWVYIPSIGKWRMDCSIKGNKICYGLWKRRVWQSNTIGLKYKTVEEAVHSLPK